MVARGDVWWVDFAEPAGSGPGYRRPAVVVSSDRFNQSRIRTVIVVALTSNLRLGAAPGNVELPTGLLPKPSVVNVTQVMAVDRDLLDVSPGRLDALDLQRVDDGLRLVLGL